jgi:ADP-ribose pyrophosphatase YjhB (NUDIX family)
MTHKKAILTVGAVIFNKNNEVLIIRNTEKSKHVANTYGIPAGRPVPHEDVSDCCIREVKEETGLVIKKEFMQLCPHIYIAELQRVDGKKCFAQVAYCTNTYSGNITSSPQTEPLWVSLDDLNKYNFIGNLKSMIRDVSALI